MLQANLAQVAKGAERGGRTLGSDFHTAALTSAVVLKPGEKLTSERVIDECGSWVSAALHFVYEIYEYTQDDASVPEAFHDVWDEYRAYVQKMDTPVDKRFMQIHNGHCTFLMPEERRFITPKAIAGTCLIGEPAAIIDQLRSAEKEGLKEVTLLPPMASARKVLKDFADEVMKRY